LTLAGDEEVLIETALSRGAVAVAVTAPHIALYKDRRYPSEVGSIFVLKSA